MEITAKMVSELREKTGVGMMECKKALTENQGNIEAAVKWLREKGISKAEKKAERSTKEGVVYSYIHSNNKVGVLIEINCETDFVARTDDFKGLCKELCLHIASEAPLALRPEDIDPALIEKEREIYRAKALNEGKPENIVDKIVDGQVKKFIAQNCLLEQEYVRDPEKTIRTLLNEAIAKTGENIQVARFVRFALGESASDAE
jgi:elongation factor Ts